MKLPTLFKKTGSGRIQEWSCEVYHGANLSTISVTYGLKGGKSVTQTTQIESGKNIGKANQTSISEQAELEAWSKWQKEKDRGYGETLEDKPEYIRPMLAATFSDKYVRYPCHLNPKLDGLRCIAELAGDELKLYSRNGKAFTSVPHINRQCKQLIEDFQKLHRRKLVLDGELYLHGEEFQKIISAVRKQEPTTESSKVEFHLFDLIEDYVWESRAKTIRILELLNKSSHIKFVKILNCNDKNELLGHHSEFISEGYEGSIIRNLDGDYSQDKRSKDLIKYKEFLDEEFKIVGFEQDKNDHIVYHCETNEGSVFKVKPVGMDAERAKLWDERDSSLGKLLNVKFFEWTTSEPKLPRFPVGQYIREDL